MTATAGAELERLREMFDQAPGAMAILRGPAHVFEMVNPAYAQLIGHREVIGKPVGEALPEVVAQGYIELLDEVYRTGEPHVGKSVTLSLQRTPQSALEPRVLDFVYQPLRDHAQQVTGIFVEASDVTERVHAEQALRDSEGRLRSLFEQTLSGIAETDLTGRFLRANRRYCEITGRSEAELQALRMHDITHPDDLSANLDRLAPTVRGEIAGFEIQKRYVRPDGFSVWVHNSVAVVRNAQGDPQSIVATTLDITESRAFEEALRQSESRFRQLIEASPVGIAISEPVGGIHLANDALLKMLGFTTADLEQAPLDWRKFTPPEQLHLDVAHIEALRRGERPPPFEKEFIRRDGGRLPVLIVGRFLPGEGERMVAFALDMTERKRAEEALRKTEKRLSRLFETNLLGVLYFDIQGEVVDANDEFLRIVGYTSEDLQRGAMDWSRMTPAEFKARDELAVAELRRVGAHAPIEKQYVRKDGSRVWVLVGSAMVDGDSGVGFVLDLSDLKTAVEALREADRRKDEFLATLAHELRNPLAPIRNAVEILKLSSALDPRAHTASEIIGRQVHHMVRLVDDLLDVSRITLGQVNLRRETVSLGAVLTEAIEVARPLIEAAGHSFTVHLPAESMQVQGDATRLSQVLQNVLNNAAKYTPKGGRITLRVERRGAEACVYVRDTGLGIPEEMQTRIFDLFTRAHPANELKTSGLGIGLALARQLIELHGGRIKARSEGPGAGSEFIITLPLLTSSSALAPASIEAASPLRANKQRVLVVDDNRDAAESLAMLLQLSGGEVDVAFDGAAALERLDSFRPEIVLLDIGMPGMDGYETARRIRLTDRGRNLLLVALSGWGQKEDKERALAAGFDEHLTKPVDPGVLSTLLKLREVTSDARA